MIKRTDRFETLCKDGSQIFDEGIKIIIRDKETGVHYLVWKSGYAGGITPLLGSDGKPVISKQ